ncbi:MAG: FN3 associated domain-containing protein [Candidatus Methylacidiphilales bacterium]|nr:FN3 associated domain-containing protein [Candidatus Methylacidiphilales bacterium]
MNLLEALQSDVTQRLESSAFFSDITVLALRPWDDAEETAVLAAADDVLTGVTFKNGKTGAAAIVQMPTIYVTEEGMPGPYFSAKIYVRVMENPTVNNGPDGTGKTAEDMGLEVLRTLHMWNPGYSGPFMTFKWRPMRPDFEFTGGASFKVELLIDLGLTPEVRCFSPVASGNSSAITLTEASADADTEIWYTTDGSFPGPENPAATEYTAPFAFPGGSGVLRAASYHTDKGGSNVLRATYS